MDVDAYDGSRRRETSACRLLGEYWPLWWWWCEWWWGRRVEMCGIGELERVILTEGSGEEEEVADEELLNGGEWDGGWSYMSAGRSQKMSRLAGEYKLVAGNRDGNGLIGLTTAG